MGHSTMPSRRRSTNFPKKMITDKEAGQHWASQLAKSLAFELGDSIFHDPLVLKWLLNRLFESKIVGTYICSEGISICNTDIEWEFIIEWGRVFESITYLDNKDFLEVLSCFKSLISSMEEHAGAF